MRRRSALPEVSHEALLDINLRAKTEETFSIGELEVLVTYESGYTVISIRGTEVNSFFSGGGWRDVCRDLVTIPYNSECMGWGHRGFLTGAEELLEEIQKRFGKNTPLVFTGHSLGGAVALACSYGAWVKGLNVREFVGFGTPKVFYKHKKLPTEEVKFTLYKNGNDLVTKVPVFSGRRLIKQIELGHSKRFWPNVSDHNLNKYKENFHQRTDNVARLKGI